MKYRLKFSSLKKSGYEPACGLGWSKLVSNLKKAFVITGILFFLENKECRIEQMTSPTANQQHGGRLHIDRRREIKKLKNVKRRWGKGAKRGGGGKNEKWKGEGGRKSLAECRHRRNAGMRNRCNDVCDLKQYMGRGKTQVISRVFTHSHAKLRALTISKMTRRGSNYVFFFLSKNER